MPLKKQKTIAITEDQKNILDKLKKHHSEPYHEVIDRLIENNKEKHE